MANKKLIVVPEIVSLDKATLLVWADRMSRIAEARGRYFRNTETMYAEIIEDMQKALDDLRDGILNVVDRFEHDESVQT